MREIGNLLKILELLRSKVHRELPLQQLVLFLAVIEKPGITMPELVTSLAMPQGTVSRNVKALSNYLVWQDGVAIPHGRNLLRTLPDAANRHTLAVFPTGRGEALADELARGLRGETGAERIENCGRVDVDETVWRNRYWSRQTIQDF